MPSVTVTRLPVDELIACEPTVVTPGCSLRHTNDVPATNSVTFHTAARSFGCLIRTSASVARGPPRRSTFVVVGFHTGHWSTSTMIDQTRSRGAPISTDVSNSTAHTSFSLATATP